MAASIVERDFIPESFLSDLDELRRRLDVVERLLISTSAADGRYLRRYTSNANVSGPPTTAELDEAFGPAASLPNPYIALVDDDGAGTNVYLVIALNGKWWGEILTELT